MRIHPSIAFAFWLFAAGVTLPAQTVDGSLRGVLLDPDDRVVSGAEVVLVDRATGLERRANSGGSGAYAFAALPAGRYRLAIRADGFKTAEVPELVIELGERARQDVRLELGPQQTTIEVRAAHVLVDRESAAVGGVIPHNYIVNLPLNGRNWLELALLLPGASPAATGSPGSVRGRFAFHANGAREDANAFLYDGAYAIDPVLNSFTFTPPVDAIQEFRIQTANAAAGQGRSSGAQVSMALQRGGNQFHGTVYEFFRNDRLDARNFFDPTDQPQPKLRRNQFGASVGGPLRRNSTFFFADFEGLRERRGVTQLSNTPTLAERSGDFSQSALPPPIDFFTGQPFADGRLPFLHPIGQAIANLYPAPNRLTPGKNFVSSPTLADDTNKFDVRLDQKIGGSGTLGGRYSFADRTRYEPFAGGQFSTVPGYGNDVDERGQNLMLSETHTLGRGWVNEARFGYSRVGNRTFHENSGTSLNRTVGLPDFATRERDLGLTFIQVTGLSPLGGEFNNPQQGAINSWQLSDTVSLAAGKHFVELGFEQLFVAGNAFRDVQSRGQISFTNFAYTQNALADLLLGLPSYTAGGRSDSVQNQRTRSTYLFAQDSWRLHRDLTLTYGLRYELNQPAYDALDAAAIYDPATRSIVQLGTNGVPRGGYATDKDNFAPRLGLAWNPGGARRTVLRAGYGLHYNLAALAAGQGVYFNPPFFQFLLYYPSQQAPLGLQDPWPSGQNVPLPPSAVTYDPNLRSSYAQNWNFSVQQDLGGQAALTVGYVGVRGTHLLGARDINQPQPSPITPNLRPLPMFSDINQIESSFDSIYHSLQAQLTCRFREGLTGLFSYTWSRSIDNASNFFASSGDANFPQNSYNTSAERGRSSFDTPHRFVGSYAYDLPFGKDRRWASRLTGVAGQLLSGWRLNGVVTLQSGQPYSVALPSELDNSNTGQSIFGFGAGDRPNVVGDPRMSNPDPAQWIDPAAFAMPAYGSFGNAGRNIVQGPPLHETSFSVLKDNKLTETTTLQLRAEMFNLFNRPNFTAPNIFFGTPGFGQITEARPPRDPARREAAVRLRPARMRQNGGHARAASGASNRRCTDRGGRGSVLPPAALLRSEGRAGGTGLTPIFTFHDPDRHYNAIEQERAATPEAPATPIAEPAPAATAPGAEPPVAAAPAAPWPYYRGPMRDGAYSQTPIRTDWPPSGLPEVWRTKVGGGYASMVVAEGKVFTIEQRRDQEVVAAYDLLTGRQVWEHGWKELFSETLGGDGPRATPTYDAGKIYALGAAGELRCLRAADGVQLWRTNILEDAGVGNLTWGMSGAPLVVDGLVVVHPGGNGKSVAAYRQDSGQIAWQSQSGKAGYASPDVAVIAGRRQILLMSGARILGLAIEDGSLLWEAPWRTSNDINSAQPLVVDDNHILISSAYGHGAALLRVAAAGDSFQVEKLWTRTR